MMMHGEHLTQCSVWMSSCSSITCWKDYPFSIELFVFVKNEVAVFVWNNFWALSSIPLIYVSVLSPMPHHLNYCSFTVSLETKQWDSSNFVLLFLNCFGCSRLFAFLYNFRISLSIPKHEFSRILIWIAESVDRIVVNVLMILSLLTHEHNVFVIIYLDLLLFCSLVFHSF